MKLNLPSTFAFSFNLRNHTKEDDQSALVAEYEAAPKNVQRPTFVRRINGRAVRVSPVKPRSKRLHLSA
jgi:hypothetical protein